MSEDGWLTKSEINALYYNTVGGEIVFATEAQASLHAAAVARLISLQALTLGRREIRILEIGANDCAFANSLLKQLRLLARGLSAGLTRIDYLAVEYARRSLEAAADRAAARAPDERVLRPGGGRGAGASSEAGGPTLVALVTSAGSPTTNLGLVHAEANEFVRVSEERFDFVILNELLDDMPYRAFYADLEGRTHELLAHARLEQGIWRIRVGARELECKSLAEMPPGTLTASSQESVELVAGLSGLLRSGGVLLMHDYGFSIPFPSLENYAPLPRSQPSFARLEFPEGSEQGFPRCFFRIFGNDGHRLVQVTNDVNFAEIGGALAPSGRVVTLAHGNMIANHPDFRGFGPDDGVFLSAFGLLTPSDDLPSLLDRLDRDQQGFRERYIRDHSGGKESVFHDLVYVKG